MNNLYFHLETQKAISGTITATYKLKEPHSKWNEWDYQIFLSGDLVLMSWVSGASSWPPVNFWMPKLENISSFWVWPNRNEVIFEWLSFLVLLWRRVSWWWWRKTHLLLQNAIERLVEDLIVDAMAKGEFENLKGTGKPLPDRVGAKKFQEVNWLRPLEPFGRHE